MTGHDGTNRIVVHPVLGDNTRTNIVRLLVDDRPMTALDGESIATALRAHGIVINRTMPDTGSPRGLFCSVGRCPDCMMTVDGKLNVRACITWVRDGMVIETQQGHGAWKVRD